MRIILLAALAACTFGATSAPSQAESKFLGIDQDNGNVYYNGHNSGRYCVYRTAQVFNRQTGYMENKRIRRCGRGLYVR